MGGNLGRPAAGATTKFTPQNNLRWRPLHGRDHPAFPNLRGTHYIWAPPVSVALHNSESVSVSSCHSPEIQSSEKSGQVAKPTSHIMFWLSGDREKSVSLLQLPWSQQHCTERGILPNRKEVRALMVNETKCLPRAPLLGCFFFPVSLFLSVVYYDHHLRLLGSTL